MVEFFFPKIDHNSNALSSSLGEELVDLSFTFFLVTDLQQKNEKGVVKHHDERDIAEPQFHIGINDFDFIRVIERGSYAKVMMVRLKETERIYAMKVIKKELVSHNCILCSLVYCADTVSACLWFIAGL